MNGSIDFLAVVSRPDFPSGSGPVGDYYNLRALIDCHPDWNAAVLELNSRPTSVEWDGRSFVVSQEGLPPIDLAEVAVALYLPICLEVEETPLCPVDPNGAWPRFAAEQWRPVTAAFEHRLSTGRCLNRPDRVRVTNNKLLQYEVLRSAGFSLPPTVVCGGFPRHALLGGADSLVAKNVSEGGWKSPEEFSPARVLSRLDATDPWPTIWQAPITSGRELRFYVMGDEVTVVELDRHPDTIDVRATNAGKPTARITDVPHTWTTRVVAMTRSLGLDYSVVDVLPTGDELHVLEVNANGVWWFLPDDVATVLSERFHRWIAGHVASAMRS